MGIDLIKRTYFLCLIFMVTSCLDRLDVEVNECYSLIAVDGKENMNLVHDYGEYALNIVPATVFAVEVYERYLIVKQHPQTGFDDVAKEYTNYYILRADNKDFYSAKASRIGPIGLEDLEKELKDLGIDPNKKIKDIVFEDLM